MAGESVEIVSRGTEAAAPAKKRNRRNEPVRLGKLELKNRILRSSMGGQMAAPDGSVTNAWKHFEKRFARTGVAGLVSATVSVDERRYSPLYYPKIANDSLIRSLAAAVSEIKKAQPDCAYILQIGDPGYHTQTSLFAQSADAKSASALIDVLYGYRSHSIELGTDEIARVVDNFAQGARRVKEAGCDGVEITASKGYLIHQFLNPGVNRRRDAYGGTTEKRFRLLREIMGRVRDAVGPDFPVGVRISAEDVNYLPLNVRLPPTWPLGDWIFGNRLAEAKYFAKELEALGADWLHVSRGFGFINPRESPGDFPGAELRRVYNSNRHLSFKGWLRSTLVNTIPLFLLNAIFGIGWRKTLGATGPFAAAIRKEVSIPVIANGGFQNRELIEDTLASGCDLVSMARPLIANQDLLRVFETREEPERPCTFCNRCSLLTSIVPMGCYEPKRFDTQADMERAILELSVDPDLGPLAAEADDPDTRAALA